MTIYIFLTPSLPSPWAGPYQVATEGDQSEPDGEEYEALTSFLGLKQEEGITRNIERKATRVSRLENARLSVGAIVITEPLGFCYCPWCG